MVIYMINYKYVKRIRYDVLIIAVKRNGVMYLIEEYEAHPDLKALVIDPDTKRLINIRIADCTSIDIEGKRRVYYIYNKKYVESHTLAELEPCAFSLGLELLDKSNLVCRDRIKFIDKLNGEVYFDEEITENSKKASVARIFRSYVIEYLKNINREEGILKSIKHYKSNRS